MVRGADEPIQDEKRTGPAGPSVRRTLIAVSPCRSSASPWSQLFIATSAD